MGAVFSLSDWRAYSLQAAKDSIPQLIQAEMATDVTFLPPIQRRRLSKLSKLSLRLAHDCAPDYQGYCVFGSQHGELVTTQRLLQSIVQGEVVSPAGFSASVHNTAVGLHSIQNQNTYPCNSIAAGRDTLAACFIEAYGLLQNGADRVLVVYADDCVPAPFDEYITNHNELHGLAVIMTAAQDTRRIELTQAESQAADNCTEPLAALIPFLSYRGPRREMLLPGEVVAWRWKSYE